MEDIYKIFIVEDDVATSRFLELELLHAGYMVATAFDGRTAIEKAESEIFDLVLLDVMIPGLNGIEVCRRIRKSSNIPIMLLTAKDGITDRVLGLDSGADDYLTKPFAIEELLARIRAMLRRRKENIVNINMQSQTNRDDVASTNFQKVIIDDLKIAIDDLKIDVEHHKVIKSDTAIELSKKEFDLLLFLMSNEGIVLSREKILEKVWGYDFEGETNIVDVYMRYLRVKIDEPFNTNMIKTIRGVGYTIRSLREQ